MTRICLASASPRRFDLLVQIGISPIVVVSNYKEPALLQGDPTMLAPEHALGKARGALSLPENALVIGADTVVELGADILGKPLHAEDAKEMLRRLSGRVHRVVSGIALLRAEHSPLVDFVITEVKFRQLTEKEITSYVATGEPLDKAGAYGIQGRGSIFVEQIRGCYTNVVGLPLTKLCYLLRQWGVDPTESWR